MTRLAFVVYGVAQPKGSTRAFVPKGWTRPIVTSDNPKNKGWQQLVAEAASAALNGHGVLFEGPVLFDVTFWLPRPKSLPKRVFYHTKKPDTDKLVRSAKDALTRVVWRDDSQVIEIRARKGYAREGESPRAEILIQAVEEPQRGMYGETRQGHQAHQRQRTARA